jgi:hypothetical protein
MHLVRFNRLESFSRPNHIYIYIYIYIYRLQDCICMQVVRLNARAEELIAAVRLRQTEALEESETSENHCVSVCICVYLCA